MKKIRIELSALASSSLAPATGWGALCAVAWSLIWALAPAAAAEPVFQQVLPAMNTTALLEYDGKVLRGLAGGGLIISDSDISAPAEYWTSGRDLSGNYISDIAWTGQNIWIATLGGGLTRVTDLTSDPVFRQYTSNLGSLEVTAVTGTVVGGTERVFYGMDGGGLGQINGGLSGNIYTAGEDGLISNDVTCLALFQDDLFIGTLQGVSLFANNVFTDQNTGLTSLEINDLILDPDGNLLAATKNGVFKWDPVAESWSLLGSIGAWVMDLASSADLVFALGLTATGDGIVRQYDGAAWSPVALPYPKCTAIAAGADFWIGGPAQRITAGGTLTFNYLGRRVAGDDFETTVRTATQVGNGVGVAFDTGGGAWMGDVDGRQISSYDAQDNSFFFIFERPYAENDTLNLFPGLGPVLSMAGSPDGTMFAGQYAGGGVLKYDPVSGTTDLMDPLNSGLEGRAIINLVVHPDGPLIVMHDWVDAQKVEVLVDPDAWQDDANWVLPPVDRGLGSGPSVWDALVETRDVIWFAVEDGGLVRWDINGPNAGPDDPLTWFDQSDDVWYNPVTTFPGSALDPGKTLGLALGRDGSIWAGGNGLVQFTYQLTGGTSLAVTVVQDIIEKSPATPEGLVNGNVKDLAVDINGDLWVATATGINRVSPRQEDPVITAWMDLANYLGNPDYQLVYSPNVIAPLPGRSYARMAASFDGRRILLSADQGTTLITVGSGTGGNGTEGDALESVYCYPNPWNPTQDEGGLRIGGLPTDTAAVGVYNLEGQLVYSDNSVAPDTRFWEGVNVQDDVVSTGLYVLTITAGGATTSRTLAIVR